MITIIDCGMGNLKSIENAFNHLGEKVKITSEAKEVKKAEKIVFPGVGNFGKAMENLKVKKLHSTIKAVVADKPFLGICLGLQLLFEESEENPGIKGLDILKGRAMRFRRMKVPQIGWNQLIIRKGKLFKGIKNKCFAYFMHSYYVKPFNKEIIAATTEYGNEFCSAIESKNIFAVQFHPEKSGEIGSQMLKNFIEL